MRSYFPTQKLSKKHKSPGHNKKRGHQKADPLPFDTPPFSNAPTDSGCLVLPHPHRGLRPFPATQSTRCRSERGDGWRCCRG